jgi:hypothetical protein
MFDLSSNPSSWPSPTRGEGTVSIDTEISTYTISVNLEKEN